MSFFNMRSSIRKKISLKCLSCYFVQYLFIFPMLNNYFWEVVTILIWTLSHNIAHQGNIALYLLLYMVSSFNTKERVHLENTLLSYLFELKTYKPWVLIKFSNVHIIKFSLTKAYYLSNKLKIYSIKRLN